MNVHLERLARRVLRDPLFLAATLTRIAESHRLDDEGLATRLGCDRDTLTHLRLCRNPDPQPPNFWADVERIASRFGVDPDRLADVVKYGQGLMTVSPPPGPVTEEAPGFLMAAREEEEEPGGES